MACGYQGPHSNACNIALSLTYIHTMHVCMLLGACKQTSIHVYQESRPTRPRPIMPA